MRVITASYGAVVATAARSRTDVDVLVIGAGLAGLAAAQRLTAEGVAALVLEREEEPGGRVRSEQWQGCTIELGASFVTPAYRRLRRLMKQCEVDGRLSSVPNAFRTGIRRDGRWHYLDFRWPEFEFVRYRAETTPQRSGAYRPPRG